MTYLRLTIDPIPTGSRLASLAKLLPASDWEEAKKYVLAAHRQQRWINQRNWIVNYGEYNFHMPSVPNVQQRRNYVKLNRPRYRLISNRPNSQLFAQRKEQL